MSDRRDAMSTSGPFTDTDRRALVAVATQFFVNGALFASFMPRLPEIRDQVDISVAGVGALISVAGATSLLGSAAVAPAIARFGTRRVMLAAGTVVSLSLPLIGLAETWIVLLAGLIGMMTFDVLVDVGMNMQGSWLSARRHTPVMNRLHGLWSVGTVVGGVTASWIAAAGVSLSVHLVSAAGVLLAVLGFVSRGLLRVDEQHEARVAAPFGTTASPASRATPILMLFGLAGLFAVAIESTSIDWAAFRMADDFSSSAGFAAFGFVAVTAGMTVGRFVGDWTTVRIGERGLLRLSIALAAAGLAVAAMSPDRYFSLAGYLVAGLGIGTMLPTLYDEAAKLPGRPGAGLGALTAGLRTASLSFPVLVGTLAATDLSVGSAIAIATLPCALGFLMVTLTLERRGSGV